MKRNGFRWLRATTVIMLLILGATTWAASKVGMAIVNLPSIGPHGNLALNSRDAGDQFNYVLINGKFTGTASGVVKNRSHRAHTYINAFSFDLSSQNLTTTADQYTVSASGSAAYTAFGTSP